MTIFGYMCDVYCDIVYSNFVIVYVRIVCANEFKRDKTCRKWTAVKFECECQL